MLKILKAYKNPIKLLKSIETTCKNTKANAITPDGDTSHFDIKAGVIKALNHSYTCYISSHVDINRCNDAHT